MSTCPWSSVLPPDMPVLHALPKGQGWGEIRRESRTEKKGFAVHPSELVEQVGGSYARQLGINLFRGNSAEIHKWFIAAVLFGARISEKIAAKTYREFEKAGVLSPHRIMDAGWDKLVVILDRGGYARYDFKTATKLLDINRTLIRQYSADLNLLHDSATDPADLEQRIKNLGKGIGDVTVNIFLRELRGIWPKAQPFPSTRVIAAAHALGFLPVGLRSPTWVLQALKNVWRMDGKRTEDFAEFEAALVRYAAALRRRGKTASDD